MNRRQLLLGSTALAATAALPFEIKHPLAVKPITAGNEELIHLYLNAKEKAIAKAAITEARLAA